MHLEWFQRRRPSRTLRSVALFSVVAVVTASFLTVWHHGDSSTATLGNDTGAAERELATPPELGGRASAAPTGSSPSTAANGRTISARPQLSGQKLAAAWLRGFLTRNDRNDDRWTAAIQPLSTSEVVDDLRAAGPDAVGLQQLTTWRVERVDQIGDVDPSLETPTRQILPYAATVTDGVRTVQKPFVLYAYLDPDDIWRIGDVEQPYSSEG